MFAKSVAVFTVAALAVSAAAVPTGTSQPKNRCQFKINPASLEADERHIWADAIDCCTQDVCMNPDSQHPNKEFILCVTNKVKEAGDVDNALQQSKKPNPKNQCSRQKDINTKGLPADEKAEWDAALKTCHEKICKPHMFIHPNKAWFLCLNDELCGQM